MKLTKLLLLPFLLSTSLLAQAQQVEVSSKAVEVQTSKVEEALRRSANPRYIVVKRFTPVYHQIADTADRRPAFRIFPGTRVYVRDYLAEGFWIDLGTVGGERYYLPAKSVKSLPVHVEI